MIGHLRGRLVLRKPPLLIIDVAGVGYEVEAPMSTFYALPETDGEITLLTHLVVREDAHQLFGFGSEGERRLFRSLIRISGVGAKMAVAILSGISVDGFIRCVHEEDTASLVRVPGVGKKTAERLIVEMRDRITDSELSAATAAGGDRDGASRPAGEAFSALVALGYKPTEVTRMLKTVDTSDLPTEEIIRRVLQSAAR